MWSATIASLTRSRTKYVSCDSSSLIACDSVHTAVFENNSHHNFHGLLKLSMKIVWKIYLQMMRNQKMYGVMIVITVTTRRSVEHCTPHADGAWLNELGWSQ